MDNLFEDRIMIEMYLGALNSGDKKKLLDKLLAFMDSHPVDLSPDGTLTSPQKRKIKFLS